MFGVDGHWLPGFDPATGSLVLPLWLAGAVAAVFVALGVVAFNRRDAGSGSVTSLLRYAVILLGLALVWSFFDQSALRERDAERRALAARADELTARAVTPGSALSCIDAGAGDVVEAACEQALFGSPEAVAAAVAYAGARVTLLADVARLNRGQAEPALRGLRRSVEADRYGLMAHVLATRQGCTPEACGAFAWLGDTSHIRTNLKQRTFDMFVAQNTARWPDHASGAMAAATGEPSAAASKGLGGEPRGAAVPTKYDFPSADSIPAVSIMNAEPAAPGPPPSRSAAGTNAAGASGTTASTPVPAPRKPQRHTGPKPSGAAPGAPMALPSAAEPEPANAQ